MRIVHVTSFLSRRSAGVRAAVESMAREQQRLGHEVVVVGLGDAAYLSGEYKDWEGLEVRACTVTGPETLGWSASMAKVIRDTKPDIVHLHGLWQGISQSVVSVERSNGIPFLLTVHGMLGEIPLTYSPIKKRIARVLFQQAAFNRAKCLHVTSQSEAKEIRAYGLKNPICVIPNGVSNLDCPELSTEPKHRRQVLSLGRLHPKKGLDILIDAWADLETDFKDWELCIVGPDENGYKSTLETQIKSLGLKRCFVKGPVYDQQKLVAMAQADIFALPTRSENFALTVGESLMLEVPVLSSKGAPWQGLELEKCGFWIDLNKNSFSMSLRRMMMLPSGELKEMGKRGRKWMQRDFSWTAVAGSLIATYSWMLSVGPLPASINGNSECI